MFFCCISGLVCHMPMHCMHKHATHTLLLLHTHKETELEREAAEAAKASKKAACKRVKRLVKTGKLHESAQAHATPHMHTMHTHMVPTQPLARADATHSQVLGFECALVYTHEKTYQDGLFKLKDIDKAGGLLSKIAQIVFFL